jgi:hypothetical protein
VRCRVSAIRTCSAVSFWVVALLHDPAAVLLLSAAALARRWGAALGFLPRSGDLPEGIYLVLTSRLVSDTDAPGFAATHVDYGQP